MKRWLRPRLIAAGLVALALAGGCSTLGEWERQMIFSPAKGEQRWHREPLAGTEVFDLEAEGERVRAWYTAAERNDAPTVLYLHGARWNLHGSVFRIERWVEMGFNVLAIDYRGFGDSSAIVPSEASARADVRAALAELRRREPEAGKRVLYGHSLGGALAIDLAADPIASEAFSAVVVESTFTSIPAVAQGMKWGWLPGLDFAIRQRFESINKIGRIQLPLLIVHGSEDKLVPPHMAEQLLASATSATKRLVLLEGSGHSGASRHPDYASTVLAFLGSIPGTPGLRARADASPRRP